MLEMALSRPHAITFYVGNRAGVGLVPLTVFFKKTLVTFHHHLVLLTSKNATDLTVAANCLLQNVKEVLLESFQSSLLYGI